MQVKKAILYTKFLILEKITIISGTIFKVWLKGGLICVTVGHYLKNMTWGVANKGIRYRPLRRSVAYMPTSRAMIMVM